MKIIQKITHPMSQALKYESIHLEGKGLNREQILASTPYKLDAELFAGTWKPCFRKPPALLTSHDHKAKLSCHISFATEEGIFSTSENLDNDTHRNQQATDILNIGKMCFWGTNRSTPAHSSTTKGPSNALSLN